MKKLCEYSHHCNETVTAYSIGKSSGTLYPVCDEHADFLLNEWGWAKTPLQQCKRV